MRHSFADSLQMGSSAEMAIADWLRDQGYTVLPAYDLAENKQSKYEGPRLLAPKKKIVAPDLLVMKKGQPTKWVEVKCKNAFAKHMNTTANKGRDWWVTGVNSSHYQDYCTVNDETPFKVHLFFIQRGNPAIGQEGASPTGIFTQSLDSLRRNIDHEYAGDSRGRQEKMIYWHIESLKFKMSLEEFEKYTPPPAPHRDRPDQVLGEHIPMAEPTDVDA